MGGSLVSFQFSVFSGIRGVPALERHDDFPFGGGGRRGLRWQLRGIQHSLQTLTLLRAGDFKANLLPDLALFQSGDKVVEVLQWLVIHAGDEITALKAGFVS